MDIERRVISYVAMLIATIYYFFGKAEASTLPPESPASLEQPAG